MPTAYWIQLRLPRLRPLVEFITLLPLVIPAIVIVFGYLRLYNSSSWLPLTGSARATDLLLIFSYVTLALPYMYRAVDTGLRAIDVRTLTEAAREPRRRLADDPLQGDLARMSASRSCSGAFLTFAIVIGEFTMASLLNRPAFGPYLQLIGANRAYEPSALAIIAFLVTWACMGLIQRLRARRPRPVAGRAHDEEGRMAFLEIENVQKSFGPAAVVQHFDLAVERGEFVSFLGPSRLRQDHDAAHGRRLRDADAPARSASTAGTSPTCGRTSAMSAWCSSPTRCSPT